MSGIRRRRVLVAAALLLAAAAGARAETDGLSRPGCVRAVVEKDPEALASYWGCRAAVEKPDDPCGAFEGLAGGEAGVMRGEGGSWAGRCEHYLHFVRFYMEVSSSAPAGFGYPSCGRFLLSCPPDPEAHAIKPDPPDLRAACGLIARAIREKRADLCTGDIEAYVNPAYPPQRWRHACRSAGQWVTGDPAACEEPRADLQGSCLREAAFVRAYRLGDAQACAGAGLENGVCRGLTLAKAGRSCDEYGASLAAKYCAAPQTPRLWLTPYRNTLEPRRDAERYARALGLDGPTRARLESLLSQARRRMDRTQAEQDSLRRQLMALDRRMTALGGGGDAAQITRLDRRMAALEARYEAADRELARQDDAARREAREALNGEQRKAFDALEAARRQVERENRVKEQEESRRPKDPMPPAGQDAAGPR